MLIHREVVIFRKNGTSGKWRPRVEGLAQLRTNKNISVQVDWPLFVLLCLWKGSMLVVVRNKLNCGDCFDRWMWFYYLRMIELERSGGIWGIYFTQLSNCTCAIFLELSFPFSSCFPMYSQVLCWQWLFDYALSLSLSLTLLNFLCRWLRLLSQEIVWQGIYPNLRVLFFGLPIQSSACLS